MSSQVAEGSKRARLLDAAAYQEAARECDVIMKGGITSGVLYPLAVCELATAYRLRNVGGTSAGAIAAAAAAAAEHGRSSQRPGSGFPGLAALPDWLGADDNLVNLFRPPSSTRRLHGLLLRAVKPGASRLGLLVGAVAASFRSRRWWMPVGGLLPGALLVTALLVADATSPLTWIGVVVALLLAVIGLVVGAALAVALDGGEAIEGNMFGLVSGSKAYDGGDSLSDWLADRLDALAGHDSATGPLTFGDLWEAPEGEQPAVNLEMQTTNVTEGRPYRLPNDLGDRFWFDPKEFGQLFPDRVVKHLIDKGGDMNAQGLVPLPPAHDLPVVVATRMSLSFPILISAVPLHSVDRSMQQGTEEVFEPSWFSDGGITSNFPISYFDSMLPSRPTFGINLRLFHPAHPVNDDDECANVWMPRTNSSGLLESWSRPPEGHGLRRVAWFLHSILDAMQNWVDNSQMRVPGYRDRVVHISHTDKEGGMNLAMPPEVLTKLSERGRCAGERLVSYYTNPPDPPSAGPGRRVVSWENHRRIRLRTSIALMSGAIVSLSKRFDESYAKDLDGPLNAAPSYPFTNQSQQALAKSFMAGLGELAQAIEKASAHGENVDLSVKAPSPAPTLRIAPGARTPKARPTTGQDDKEDSRP
ncbi:RpoH suppressor SuhR [Intrasporangium mesophilum]